MRKITKLVHSFPSPHEWRLPPGPHPHHLYVKRGDWSQEQADPGPGRGWGGWGGAWGAGGADGDAAQLRPRR